MLFSLIFCVWYATLYSDGVDKYIPYFWLWMVYSAEVENDFVLFFRKLFELRVSYEKCHNVSLLKSIMIWSKFKDGMRLYVWF